jgi:hypothetical protein
MATDQLLEQGKLIATSLQFTGKADSFWSAPWSHGEMDF